jgi:hypothetical protein
MSASGNAGRAGMTARGGASWQPWMDTTFTRMP